MPVEIVAELLAVGGQLAVHALIAGPVREWRLSSFYGDLDRDRKRAFLEIVCAAIVHDGQVSEAEQKWLDRRATSDENDGDLVESALGVAKAALSGAAPATYRAYVAERAEAFAANGDREKVYVAAAVLLQGNGASTSTLELFGDALGLAGTRRGELDAQLAQLMR